MYNQTLLVYHQNYRKNGPNITIFCPLDPYKTLGFPSHSLIGKLRGFRALEIDWNQISYRLVYRIYEKPSPQRVIIVSFAEHDDAYFLAKQRK